MGLAIGFRLTAFWAAFAFIFWLWREKRLRSSLPFAGAMAVTSLVAYSPVLATYGLRHVQLLRREGRPLRAS